MMLCRTDFGEFCILFKHSRQVGRRDPAFGGLFKSEGQVNQARFAAGHTGEADAEGRRLRAAKLSGNGGVGAFGIMPKGTMTVGIAGLSGDRCAVWAREKKRVKLIGLHHFVDSVSGAQGEVFSAIQFIARSVGFHIHFVGDVEIAIGRI